MTRWLVELHVWGGWRAIAYCSTQSDAERVCETHFAKHNWEIRVRRET
jgi:hypothetical protein